MLRRPWTVPAILLLGLLPGCKPPEGLEPTVAAAKAPGMTAFEYLASDGGPHLVLPKELAKRWSGVTSWNPAAPLDPKSDYGRACAVASQLRLGLIDVGSGHAMVLPDPPMSAWGHSPESWVDIYVLKGWNDMNLDALIQRAVAAAPTKKMTDRGLQLTLKEPGLLLLAATDSPSESAYGVHSIPIETGTYRILEGTYKAAADEVLIYRLQPKKP